MLAKPYFRLHNPRAPHVHDTSLKQLQHTSYKPTDIPKVLGYGPAQTNRKYTIYIPELGGGYVLSALQSYAGSLGMFLPPIRDLSVNGAQNAPGDPTGADMEVALDILCAAGVGGQCIDEIVMVWAPNAAGSFANAVNLAVHDAAGLPAAGSISWGGPETGFGTAEANATDAAFAASPFPWFVAAGDNGSRDGTNKQVVDLPAACPHAYSCGGVYLLADPTTGKQELVTVWNDGTQGGATGGGISGVFKLPSQQNGLMAIEHGGKDLGPPMTGRGVPDVAAIAAPESGIEIVSSDGKTYVVGGTSACAPTWAGRVALEDRMGQSLTDWYEGKGPKFKPVVQVDGYRKGNGFYWTTPAAKPGWSACTGLGT